MSAILYHMPYFVSSVVANLIGELGISEKVQVKIIGFDNLKDEFHLAKHPQGKVPFYIEVEDDFTMIESSAIFLYLLEKHDTEKKLSNWKDAKERGQFYQFLLNCPCQIYPNLAQLFYQFLNEKGSPMRDENLITKNLNAWHFEIAPFLVKYLGDKPYFFGDQFTAVDILLGYQMVLAELVGQLKDYPTLVAYLLRLRERPAFTNIYNEANKIYLPDMTKYSVAIQRKIQREEKLASEKGLDYKFA
ncbi:hypothetical protein PPL_07303 [Heterostelium album PN500]|uniref:Glutathione S-transferase n=1 Tax=Heterostelium pallidum (strain ATCC 26659 / Pp 5 / PN500) TaxID=670386 RepID=D3BEY7_HETP5|nr:hypothetical protein PPL_07303 [Heterostelium album PN500]EFA80468.1 hypothetical protein PPL_07303 [Heterostelium album PN500]|eukprot:XP_020432588.1 hypothetical protein PPL_07303 [Heterostelium album PN500]